MINWLDVLLLLGLAVSLMVGFSRGGILELLSLTALLAGLTGAVYLVQGLMDWGQSSQIGLGWILGGSIIVAISIFIIIYWVGHRFGAWLSDKVEEIMWINVIDKALGLLFGLGRAYVVACFVFAMVLWAYTPEMPLSLITAYSAKLIAPGLGVLADMASVADGDSVIREFDNLWQILQQYHDQVNITEPNPPPPTALKPSLFSLNG